MNILWGQRTALLKERLITFWILLIILTGIIFFVLINPATDKNYPSCPFRFVTGGFCPGCGSSRAIHQTLQGNIYASFRLNPLMMLALPFLLYAYISYWFLVIRGKMLPMLILPKKIIIGIFVIIILYWILRNIPAFPFTLLAPYQDVNLPL